MPSVTPFLVRVHAAPGDKILFDGPTPKGYFQRLGVTAHDEAELTRLVQEFVSQDTGGRVLEIDDLVVADPEGAHRTLCAAAIDPRHVGVWHLGGRAFYDDDEDDGADDEEPEND
jgi:hypothetical protein